MLYGVSATAGCRSQQGKICCYAIFNPALDANNFVLTFIKTCVRKLKLASSGFFSSAALWTIRHEPPRKAFFLFIFHSSHIFPTVVY